MTKTIFRWVAVVGAAFALYLSVIVGADAWFGAGELRHQWLFGSKRELATQLIVHSASVGVLLLVGFVCVRLSALWSKGLAIAVWIAAFAGYFVIAEYLWLPTVTWFLALTLGLILLPGRATA